MEARLTKEDLKDKDVAEAVDCIIKHFGGLKAVQRELRNKGTSSGANVTEVYAHFCWYCFLYSSSCAFKAYI